MDRRGFLKLVGAGAGGLAVGLGVDRLNSSSARAERAGGGSAGADSDNTVAVPSDKPVASTAKGSKLAPVSQRRLVIVELDGGNDAMSTLVPHGSVRYRDLRPRTGLEMKELHPVASAYAVPKTLKDSWDTGMAFVMGVGTPDPDGSHFAMMHRWWTGDPSGKLNPPTGFLGRLCDLIGDPAAPATGICVGTSLSPALLSRKAATVALPNPDMARYLVANKDNEQLAIFQRNFAAMMQGEDDPLVPARASGRSALEFAGSIAKLGDEPQGYPGSHLGQSLSLVARMLSTNPSLRVAMVSTSGYDTHSSHRATHAELMTDVNTSLVAFVHDLERRGLRNAVAVATTSEFGRKARDNASDGLDHGAASVAMVLGAVNPGLYGEYSPLDRLDNEGNLIATMSFDSYYATLAEKWFEVPASEVLSGNVKPIDKLFG